MRPRPPTPDPGPGSETKPPAQFPVQPQAQASIQAQAKLRPELRPLPAALPGRRAARVPFAPRTALSRRPGPVSGPGRGSPPPADDYLDRGLDLNEHLIAHPEATFFLRVPRGVHDRRRASTTGTSLIVDRAMAPGNGRVVVAALSGELTVKRLRHTKDGLVLAAEHPDYPDRRITPDMDFEVWGVVRHVDSTPCSPREPEPPCPSSPWWTATISSPPASGSLSLRFGNRPVVVLSNNDGCVIARSAEAKALGIRMGQPAFECARLCQRHGVAVVSSNYALYGDLSARVMAVLAGQVPDLEVYSIDEAFLVLSGLPGDPVERCRAIRAEVYRRTGMPVSIRAGGHQDPGQGRQPRGQEEPGPRRGVLPGRASQPGPGPRPHSRGGRLGHRPPPGRPAQGPGAWPARRPLPPCPGTGCARP